MEVEMDKGEIIKKIQEIFQDLLDDESFVIDRNYTKNNIKDWDSLFHMTMMQTVASEFNIEISIDEIVKTDSTDFLVELVNEKLK